MTGRDLEIDRLVARSQEAHLGKDVYRDTDRLFHYAITACGLDNVIEGQTLPVIADINAEETGIEYYGGGEGERVTYGGQGGNTKIIRHPNGDYEVKFFNEETFYSVNSLGAIAFAENIAEPARRARSLLNYFLNGRPYDRADTKTVTAKVTFQSPLDSLTKSKDR